jgi:hypothetical protein
MCTDDPLTLDVLAALCEDNMRSLGLLIDCNSGTDVAGHLPIDLARSAYTQKIP